MLNIAGDNWTNQGLFAKCFGNILISDQFAGLNFPFTLPAATICFTPTYIQ